MFSVNSIPQQISFQKQANNPIFIVGCARSGTTLLQSLLASHFKIASFPESKFFTNLVRMPEELSRRYALGIVAPHTKSSLEGFLDEIGHPELKYKIPKLPLIKLYVKSFQAILSELAHRQGKSIWLEKTPEHLHYLKYIEAYIPNARIIHIVRSGMDVVASLYDLAQRYPNHWGVTLRTLDDCIERWINDVSITKRNLDKPNHTLVLYEDLVKDSASEIERICKFLDVPFDEQCLLNYRTVATDLIRSRETWKQANKQDIIHPGSKKFMSVFTKDQQEYVYRIVESVELPKLS